MKKYILIVLTCSFLWSVTAQVLPNTYIVKLRNNAHKSTALNLLQTTLNNTMEITQTFPNHSLTSQQKTNKSLVDLSLIYTVSVSDSLTEKSLSELMQSGCFEYIQPKYTHQYLYIPNDPNIASQWHLSAIKAYEAWDICQGDSNIVIGILDSGIDTNNIDLKTNIKYNYDDPIDGVDNDNDGFVDNFYGWNIGDNNRDVSQVSIHGSFVAALAAAATDDNNGVAGVGFKCKMLPVRIHHSSYGIINGYEAIVYAADHGCNIINCSWGSVSPFDQFGQDIVNYATYNRNALVVAACGNTPMQLSLYPAAYDNVFSVAATKSSGDMADFTTYDYSVDIAAPGQAIYSTSGSSYLTSDGTSFSCPIVSGVAALVKSKYPQMLPQQIAARIKATADSVLTAVGTDMENKVGAGQVNAYRALSESFSPYIALQNIVADNHVLKQNEQIKVYGDIINYFSFAPNVTVKASVVNSTALDFVKIPTSIGNLDSMQVYSSNGPLFVLRLNEDVVESKDFIVHVQFFSDTNCVGSQHISLRINTFMVLDTNNQVCTITNCGRFAYEDNQFRYGQGIKLKPQTKPLLSYGSLLFGNNGNRVSDNIYGNREMSGIVSPHLVNDKIADMHIQTIFNDAEAGYNKFDIEVVHDAYAWTDNSLSNSTVHRFSLINKSTENLSQFYVALFMDWDIFIANANRITYDNELKISYTKSLLSGPVAGIKFLSDYSTKIYAFDNDGSNLSMAINKGFTDLQKYNAMTTNRTSAGIANEGNDVSVMMSYGPLSLPIGDTITIAYAFVLGDFVADVQQEAIAVQNKYHEVFVPHDTTYINEANTEGFFFYPNPAKDFVCIENKTNLLYSYQLFDTKSTLLMKEENIAASHLNININMLPTGMYILKIGNERKTMCRKFIKE